MDPYYAYTFLTGLYIGGYTNLFSKMVISGLVLYIIHPDNFNPKRFRPLYNQVYNYTYPYVSKVYSFAENFEAISPLPPLPNKSPKLKIVEN